MTWAKYVGARVELQGRTALIQWSQSGCVAQFDDWDLPGALHLGWHAFDRSEFEVIPGSDDVE